MGLLTRYLASSTPTGEGSGLELVAHTAETALAEVTWPTTDSAPWDGTGRLSRAQAMQVPAVARARNIIAGTVGILPLAGWDEAGARVPRPRPWIAQPERDLTTAHTLAWTADDLFFGGVAFWRVTDVYREDGRPMRFERIAPARVSPEVRGTQVVGWRVDGQLAPRIGVGRLVVFPGLEEGLLNRASRTIRTALLLEEAAANYAREPVPATVLRNTGAAHLSDTKIEELLGKWRTARRTKASAYLDALELQAVGIDPAGMQLVEARQHLAVEIARACNLDPYYVGANEGGASLTYTNVTQERRKLVDFTLRHYLSALEGRLTMDDVTPLGERIRFDLDDFLRGDAETRARVIQTLVSTTDAEGRSVMTVDEARAREGLTG